MAGWKKIVTSGSDAVLNSITASHLKITTDFDLPDALTLTTDVNYNFSIKPSNDNNADVGASDKRWKDGYFAGTVFGTSSHALTASHIEGGAGFPFSASGDNQAIITGSLDVTQKISASNINVGNPTSNNWGENLEGSFFNNFTPATDVSEILRFMAGLLSHSAAQPTPNTKFYNSVTSRNNSLGSLGSINGRVPGDFAQVSDTLTYLNNQGFANEGSTLFNGIEVRSTNFSSYNIDFDSNAGGSTTIRSSNDSNLFNLGEKTDGLATEFRVKITATQSFSDNSTNTSPSATNSQFSSASSQEFSINEFGSSNGLTLAEINTDNPAVIPPVFQDGKFNGVGELKLKFNSEDNDGNSILSSGYYRFHDLKVGIATGSQEDFTFKNAADKELFYANLSEIEDSLPSQNITVTNTVFSTTEITSRSLSGVPYLQTAQYTLSSQVNGLFSPLYANSDTLVDHVSAQVEAGNVEITSDRVSISNGNLASGMGNRVFTSNGSTAKSVGSIPAFDDIAIFTNTPITYTATGTNIDSSGIGVSSDNFNVRIKCRDRNDTQNTFHTENITYHPAGTFGHDVASGSLAIYGRNQGYDGSNASTEENFSGEAYRIQLNDNVLEFAGDTWNSSFNEDGLGDFDLQVKPGFLVEPGSQYGYWFPANYKTQTCKFYIRQFTVSENFNNMTLNVGKVLESWNGGSNGVSVALLFKSSTTNGASTSFTTARIYDPTATTSNVILNNITNNNITNPFGESIDLYGNDGGSLNSTTYSIPLRNADGMFLNSGDNSLYVIVRYRGSSFTPITSINLTFS